MTVQGDDPVTFDPDVLTDHPQHGVAGSRPQECHAVFELHPARGRKESVSIRCVTKLEIRAKRGFVSNQYSIFPLNQKNILGAREAVCARLCVLPTMH